MAEILLAGCPEGGRAVGGLALLPLLQEAISGPICLPEGAGGCLRLAAAVAPATLEEHGSQPEPCALGLLAGACCVSCPRSECAACNARLCRTLQQMLTAPGAWRGCAGCWAACHQTISSTCLLGC